MDINNITRDGTTTTPEPGTLGMLGSGILTAAGIIRCRLYWGSVHRRQFAP